MNNTDPDPCMYDKYRINVGFKVDPEKFRPGSTLELRVSFEVTEDTPLEILSTTLNYEILGALNLVGFNVKGDYPIPRVDDFDRQPVITYKHRAYMGGSRGTTAGEFILTVRDDGYVIHIARLLFRRNGAYLEIESEKPGLLSRLKNLTFAK